MPKKRDLPARENEDLPSTLVSEADDPEGRAAV